MTYKKLIAKLMELPAERLNDDVTVYCFGKDEFYASKKCGVEGSWNAPCQGAGFAGCRSGVLDDGHFYLVIP